MFKKFFIILSLFCFIFFIGSLSVKASVPPSEPMTYTGSTTGGVNIDVNNLELYLEDFDEYSSEDNINDFVYEASVQNKEESDERYTIAGHKLTADEILLIVKNLWYLYGLKKAYNYAVELTNEFFPTTNYDGGKGNAFQHCVWTMFLMKYTNHDFALEYVRAHENYESNKTIHKEMDLYNNDIAFNAYKNAMQGKDEELDDAAISLLSSLQLYEGKLKYIIFNYTYTKEVIYYAATNRRVYRKASGDFYAYTNSDVPYNVPDTKYITVLGTINGNTLLASL